MINGIIKTAALTPDIRVGDVKGNLKNALSLANEAAALGAKIAVFPELSLTGATAGDLFFTSTIHKSAEAAVSDFADATEELDTLFFIGAPVSLSGRIYNATVAIYGGDILGIIPKASLSADERELGGLGIFMVRKMASELSYSYEDGCNVLTVTVSTDAK